MINAKNENRLQDTMVKSHNKYFEIISFVVLVIVLLISIMKFAMELIVNLKAYNIIKGIWGSPWVGLKNIMELVNSFYFIRIIQNTLLFNILFSLLFFTITVTIGYIIIALPQRLKEIAAVFCALPVFMPSQIYVSWLINSFGSSVFTNPEVMRFLHPFFCAVKYAGIPIMAIYILSEIYVDKNNLIPLKAAGLFSVSSLAFIANGFYSLTSAMYNPMVYESMDIADTYVYRRSFMSMEMGSNAMGLIQTIITVLSVIFMFIPIWLLFSSIFKGEKKDSAQEKISSKIISSVIAVAVFAVIYFLPYIVKDISFDTKLSDTSLNIGYSIFVYLVLSIISALIATVLAAIMSGAFISNHKMLRLAAGIILVIITILTVRPVNFFDYLLIRSIGAFNTVYAIILATLFSSVAVWAMVALLNSENRVTIKSVLFAMTGLLLIQAAVNYGNVIPPLLYLNNQNISPVLIFRQLQIGIQTINDSSERASAYGIISLYGFLASLPSLLLFLTANIILPKGKLLSIIAAGVKS